MPTALSRIIFCLLLVLIFLPKTVSATNASEYKPGSPEYVNYTVLSILSTIGCVLAGTSLIPNQECLDYDSSGNIISATTNNGGAIGGATYLLATLYTTQPLSTSEYLADLNQQLSPVQSANAQSVAGAGNGVIQPVLKLWQIMRNIAYIAFIVVFVVVGLMIMFRQKLNPQTTITAQAALPGLIVGLILVTFSYFISALLIDTSFVGMKLVGGVFASTGMKTIFEDVETSNLLAFNKPYTPDELATNSNIFNLGIAFIYNKSLGDKVFGYVFGLVRDAPDQIIRGYDNGAWLDLTKTIMQILTTLLGVAVGALLVVIIIIALFVQIFRLTWQLISAYINILVLTVFSPLIILASSIPGRGGGLSFWWKTILANSLVFPAVFATFLFAGLFLSRVELRDFTTTMPFFSGLPVDVLKIIIGYGFVLGSPAVPKMVKDAMGVKDIAGIPQEAVGALRTSTGALGAGYSKYTERLRQERQAWRDAVNRNRFAQANANTPPPRRFPWIY